MTPGQALELSELKIIYLCTLIGVNPKVKQGDVFSLHRATLETKSLSQYPVCVSRQFTDFPLSAASHCPAIWRLGCESISISDRGVCSSCVGQGVIHDFSTIHHLRHSHVRIGINRHFYRHGGGYGHCQFQRYLVRQHCTVL